MKSFNLILGLTCFLTCFSSIHAQSKYGKITQDELEMITYNKDTTATAVILSKEGDIQFLFNEIDGFIFQYEEKVKIKILKTEGLSWCSGEIPFYEYDRMSREKIIDLSGMTYNLDEGKIVKTKLGKDNIFEEEINDSWKVRKFSMPAAKVGSVIEYKYKITSPFFSQLRDFQFQAAIPIAHSKLIVNTPEYFVYNTDFRGYIRLDINKKPVNGFFTILSRGETTRIDFLAEELTAIGTDVPAMKEENNLWSINDYISKVSFEFRSFQPPYGLHKHFSTSWNDVDKSLQKSSLGKNLDKKGLFKDFVTQGELNEERLGDILHLVKTKMKWNKTNSMYPKNLKKALEEGIGTSSEVNLLLLNALKAAGFDAFPIILSTRQNGMVPFTHPSQNAFNYVIVGVELDEKMYYADATMWQGNWNSIPLKCAVNNARILKDGHSRWTDLTSLAKGAIIIIANIKFEDGKQINSVTERYLGSRAFSIRTGYANYNNDDDFIKEVYSSSTNEIDSYELKDMNQDGGSVTVTLERSSEKPLDENYIYINPLSEVLYSTNPFTQEERTYPVNFPDYLTYNQVVNIEIPKGYVVDELPQSEKIIMDNDITLLYQTGMIGNKVNIRYQFKLNKLLFLPTEYEVLKDTFSKIVNKNSEQIVLKKIEG